MAYGILKCDNITFDNGGSDQNVTVSGLYRATTSGVTLSGTIAATTVSGVTIIGSTTVSGATVTGTTANFTSGNFSNIISSTATMSGALIMANQQQVRFREAVGNGTNHIALQAPAIVSADQTITLPDQTGTVVTTGDNGSVTSTMILDGTILNADINASAAIAGTKISPDFGSQTIVTTGVHSAAAGSATTPSIAFTGDLNTGIYSPGADQLAVSTGGTGRLFVDSSGSVGIGTSSPAYGLHLSGINATSSTAQIATTATSDATVRTTTSLGTFAFGTGIGSATKCWNVYDVDNSAERLRIDSSGRVGIGTSSPGHKLDVAGGVNSTGLNATGTGGFFNSASKFGVDNNGGVTRMYSSGPDASTRGSFDFRTTDSVGTLDTSRMVIDSSGNVGIGTASPGYKLEVYGDGTSTSTLALINPSATNGAAIYFADTNHSSAIKTIPAAGTHSLGFFVAGSTTERLRIDSSGRVGIGTSSPTQLLSLAGTSANILLAGTSNSYTSYNIGASNVGYVGDANWIFAGSSSDFGIRATSNLVFGIGATERLRIDSSGRVGIGTSSPWTPGILDCFGNAKFGASSTNGLYLGLTSGTPYIQGYNTTTPSSSVLAFYGGAGEAMRVDSSGRLLVGTSSASGGYLNNNSLVHVQAEGSTAGITIHRPTTFSALAGPYLVFSRSRGTPAVIVNSGDNLGSIEWGGADGTDVESIAALIRAEVDGTPGANDMPGRLVFSVTADSAASPTEALRISNDRSITVSDGGNVVLGTTTGTKIGTGTTQKIGFYNATPVVQPTAVADATDAATVITQLNALLTRMRNLGLIAT